MALKDKTSKSSLKLSELFEYGGGSLFAYTFYLMLQAYYMLFFLTNVLGFETVVAASIYTATQVIKVITMIFAGVIIDATCLKWGKYRSWIAIGAIFTSVFSTLMFTNFGLPVGAGIVVFIIVFIIQSLAYNTMWVASRSSLGPMSKTSDDAVALASAAQVGTSAGGICYGLIGVALITAFTATGQPYGCTAAVYGVIILVGTFFMMKVTKKYDKPLTAEELAASKDASKAKKGNKVGFKEMLKSLTGPMIPYFFAMTFGTAQTGFFFALLTYFTTYVLANPAVMSYALTINALTAIVGALVAKPICAKFGKKMVFIGVGVLQAILYFCMNLNGANAVGFLVIYGGIGFLGAFSGILLPAFANDLADYKEMKGESNARAFIQSIAGTSIRLAGLISTTVASFGLAAVGYQAGADMTPAVLSGITNLMVIGPMVVCIISIICMLFYKVSEKDLDEYRKSKVANAAAAAEAPAKADEAK